MATTAALRPVAGPALWYGPDLAARTDWLRHLTPEEVAALAAAAARLAEESRDLATIGPGDIADPALDGLVEEIRAAVLRGRGFILLRGVPVDRWSRRQAAAAYLGLGARLGEPVPQNAMGHVLGHVKDIGGDYAQPTHRGYQTAARLPYHCDAADVVGLLCLQPSKSGGKSSLVSSWALFNEMLARHPDLLPELVRPVYRDRRGEVPEGAEPWYAVPVFSPMPDGGLVATYVRSAMRKAQRFPEVPRSSPALEAACDALDALADDPSIHLDMDFQPGDIQFVSNHWIMHSRTAFEDFPEPAMRRHLFRLWLACPDGPALPEAFTRAWQGATQAGRPAGIRVPGVTPSAPLDATW
jgi:alpha-ketoglutarate-dependent taurine dioxygenase